jgi:quercetin dioxygenase-like cupin family protein
MHASLAKPQSACLIRAQSLKTLDVLGAAIELLTPSGSSDSEPSLMRGKIPPGGAVPLHCHADPETFLLLAGEMEGYSASDGIASWIVVHAGDVFHVPGNVKHAFRNRSALPAVSIIVSTAKLARFFEEVGVPPVQMGSPPRPAREEVLRHFLTTAARYGYWNASPAENAEIGLDTSFSPPLPEKSLQSRLPGR